MGIYKRMYMYMFTGVTSQMNEPFTWLASCEYIVAHDWRKNDGPFWVDEEHARHVYQAFFSKYIANDA